MRRSTQTTSDLRLVMLFDRRNQTCCVCSHNLDAEDASQEVAELRRDGLPAFTVDQHSRHSETDPDECPACLAHIRQSVSSPPTPSCRKHELILPLVPSRKPTNGAS
jgi:hypothetical protein